MDELAVVAKRFMVLSVNSRDGHEFWVDGFGETVEDALRVALGMDSEWELVAIYDLLAELLDLKESIISVRNGLRAVVGPPGHKLPFGEPVWDEDPPLPEDRMCRIEVGDTVIVTEGEGEEEEQFEGVVENVLTAPEGCSWLAAEIFPTYLVNGKYGVQPYIHLMVALESKCIEIGDIVEVTDDEHEDPYQGKVIDRLYKGPKLDVLVTYIVKGDNFVIEFGPEQVRLVRKGDPDE